MKYLYMSPENKAYGTVICQMEPAVRTVLHGSQISDIACPIRRLRISFPYCIFFVNYYNRPDHPGYSFQSIRFGVTPHAPLTPLAPVFNFDLPPVSDRGFMCGIRPAPKTYRKDLADAAIKEFWESLFSYDYHDYHDYYRGNNVKGAFKTGLKKMQEWEKLSKADSLFWKTYEFPQMGHINELETIDKRYWNAE